MEDFEMFNVCSTEIWSVVISISSIICVYLAISNNVVLNVWGRRLLWYEYRKHAKKNALMLKMSRILKIDRSQNKKWLSHIIITVIRGHGLRYAAVKLSPHYFEKRRRSWNDAYEAGDDWLKQFYHNRIFCFVCILWTSQFLQQQYNNTIVYSFAVNEIH